MTRCASARLATTLLAGLLAILPTSVHGGRSSTSLVAALEREHGLLEASLANLKAQAELQRIQTSTQRTARLIDYATAQYQRHLAAYQAKLEPHTAPAQTRGRALYKLSRGQLTERALAGAFADPTVETRPRGRALLALVRHDLHSLRTHQRAHRQATDELMHAIQQARLHGAQTSIQALHGRILEQTNEALQDAASSAWSRRRALVASASPQERTQQREILQTIQDRWHDVRRWRQPDYQPRIVRPVPGPVVGGFGPYIDPQTRLPMTRQGVELQSKVRAAVFAPDHGIVAKTAELSQRGRAIVIDHQDGRYSLLAGLGPLDVQAGDTIARGQPIGTTMAGPHQTATIYFEMRHGEAPIDPTPLIRRAQHPPT